LDEWLILQSFYNRLTPTSRAHIDTAAGGAFLDLTIAKATTWSRRWSPTKGGVKNAYNPESRACTPSRRWTCLLQRWTSF
jgi:hypothetical protein